MSYSSAVEARTKLIRTDDTTNTPISKWRNAKDLGLPCCFVFKPAKSPQPYFITYNQFLFDFLQNNVSIIKFDPVLAFISQILASC